MANTKKMSDEEKLKVQDLSPRKADKCKKCGQELPGNAPTKKQESAPKSERVDKKMRHGQY